MLVLPKEEPLITLSSLTSSLERIRNSNRTKKKVKLKKAREKAVKPSFIVNGADSSASIWNAVKTKTTKPKIDNCKKLPSGDFLVTTSDRYGLNPKGYKIDRQYYD